MIYQDQQKDRKQRLLNLGRLVSYCIYSQAEPSQASGLPPGRVVLVVAIVVGCFGILWPRIFSPMVFGEALEPAKTDDDGDLLGELRFGCD